jgi:hypothetical protein
MHYPGGAFEDFDKAADEMLKRNFNTVRIDAFPLVIYMQDSIKKPLTIKGNKYQTWGPTDKDREHDFIQELLSFMKTTREKNINVILSTWGQSCLEFSKFRTTDLKKLLFLLSI